jgi:hypothetical protein
MLTIKAEPAGASLTRPWPADQPERWSIERLIPLGLAKAIFDNVTWRWVRVEGVVDAVRLNQRRSEKWHERMVGRDYAGAAGERKPAAAAPHDALRREGRTTHPADV